MEMKQIKFNLKGWKVLGFNEPGMSDYGSGDEYEEAVKERTVWLLGISTETFIATEGYPIYKPCAVVEDTDGKVYKINPENITIIND